MKNLTLPGFFRNVSFKIREGEIVGLMGLVGAGRTEIAESIFGIRPPASGEVYVSGERIKPKNPNIMRSKGVAYIPENRDENGLILAQGVAENVCLTVLDSLSLLGFISHRSEKTYAQPFVDDLEIKTESLDTPVDGFQGNRQKVVLAKWLATKLGSLSRRAYAWHRYQRKSQVHKRIFELAAEGFAVLLISSDLPEIMAMSDRILVVSRGEIVDEFTGESATQEELMTAAVSSRGRKDRNE